MTRVETIGDCTLYLGDCLEVMPTLGKVDAVVTDPPYGIGWKPLNSVKGALNKRLRPLNFDSIKGDDKPFDPSPLLRWDCIIWGANHFVRSLPDGRWLVWNKLGSFEPFGDPFSDVEIAWFSKKGADRIFSLLWKGVKQGEKTDNGRRYHPNMKPVGLMKWCLGFLPDAQTILDPFMGSGTTGVACVKLGRKFIGIELDEGYFDIACKRIRDAYAQPDFFVERPAPAEQVSMTLTQRGEG